MVVDELLAALPNVGLQLWLLGDSGSDGWYCVLNEIGRPVMQHSGNGATAAEALSSALSDAGVNLEEAA